ncbi:MAG: lamin tail domain-containing protein [Phycisphaerae bacterium]|nr:lamin tail domain-containing protein [Phycisphaerae bacterium]
MHHWQSAATLGMVLFCLLSGSLPAQTPVFPEESPNDPGFIHTIFEVNQVESVVLSQPRGFYTHAFYLILTTNTEDATVFYTTDGSVPTPETGMIALEKNQAFPLIISKTTCVRAVAVRPGWHESDIVTHTYLFLNDVINNPDASDQDLIEDALLSVPSVMLATDEVPSVPNLSSEVSVEWLMPDDPGGIQVTAYLSLRPAPGLRQASDKISFHVDFQNAAVDYPLFDSPDHTAHTGFDLYASPDDSWHGGAGPYASQVRDCFSHDLQAETGQPSLRNRFCHVYINGRYRGLYQMQEQIDALAKRTHPDASMDDLDILVTDPVADTTVAMQGTRDALDRLAAAMEEGFGDMSRYYRVQGMNALGHTDPAYERLLDVDNLIDFMIVEYLTGDTNGPGSRLNGGRPNHILALLNHTEPDGFKWVQYNNEWSLGTGDIDTALASQNNMVEPLASDTMTDPETFSCHVLHEHLITFNSDYRMRFADRVFTYFFHDGIMTEARTRALLQARANQIQVAMVAEAARWGEGGQSRDTWLAEISRLMFGTTDHQGRTDTRLLTGRTQTVLAQFKAKAWYPGVAAPTLNLPSSQVLPGSRIAMSAPQGTLYVTLDGTDPRASEGRLNPSAGIYTGPIPITDTTQIKARARVGTTWSTLSHATFVTRDITDSLRVSEMMPDPLAPFAHYIELKNIGSTSINLAQVRLSEAVDFTFPAMPLAPSDFVLVVQDKAAFEARYGAGLPVAGEYSGMLSPHRERLVLQDPIGRVIHDFDYEAAWYDIVHDRDFSLTVRPEALTEPGAYGDAMSWRPSHVPGGSPGSDDIVQAPLPGTVIITEILSHSHDIASDWIELYNTTDEAIHVGGWFLSDDLQVPQKYEIAYGTMIEPHGFLVLYEVQQFGNPFDPGTQEPFALSENGEILYVFSGLDGALTGFEVEETFGASITGIPFGLYMKSTGTDNFVAMSEPTPGQPNADPLVGPVVISEIMYHPAGNEDAEYVELINISGDPVALFDPIEYLPWRFQDDPDGSGISLPFPLNPGLELQPGERLLLVMDKTAFYSSYNVPGTVKILEWPSGKLNNSGEKIQLDQPGDVDLAGQRYWIRVDRVNFSDGSHPDNSGIDLWPAGPDGNGWSLQRVTLNEYGNDPANWQAGLPTPGW